MITTLGTTTLRRQHAFGCLPHHTLLMYAIIRPAKSPGPQVKGMRPGIGVLPSSSANSWKLGTNQRGWYAREAVGQSDRPLPDVRVAERCVRNVHGPRMGPAYHGIPCGAMLTRSLPPLLSVDTHYREVLSSSTIGAGCWHYYHYYHYFSGLKRPTFRNSSISNPRKRRYAESRNFLRRKSWYADGIIG